MSWNTNERNLADYLEAAKHSATDPVFEKFRKISILYHMTGTSPLGHACTCYQKVKETPIVKANADKFGEIDKLGQAPQMQLIGHEYVSGNTWRHAETAAYLYDAIGDINGDVVEFGSNYGSLAHVLLTQYPSITTYWTMDFEEMQMLSNRVLGVLGHYPKIRTVNPPAKPFLYVSEYCLTEQKPEEIIPMVEGLEAEYVWLRANIFDAALEGKFFKALENKYELMLNIPEKPEYRKPNKMVLGRRKI